MLPLPSFQQTNPTYVAAYLGREILCPTSAPTTNNWSESHRYA